MGDLFNSQAQTLTNTVNCVGAWGRGIALGFGERYPDMTRDYEARCKAHKVYPGVPYVYRRKAGPLILNFPTKDHWRGNSKLAWIEQGLELLVGHYQEWGIESLAIPALGCNNGRLDWKVVEPLMRRYLDMLDIPVELYPPLEMPT